MVAFTRSANWMATQRRIDDRLEWESIETRIESNPKMMEDLNALWMTEATTETEWRQATNAGNTSACTSNDECARRVHLKICFRTLFPRLNLLTNSEEKKERLAVGSKNKIVFIPFSVDDSKNYELYCYYCPVCNILLRLVFSIDSYLCFFNLVLHTLTDCCLEVALKYHIVVC